MKTINYLMIPVMTGLLMVSGSCSEGIADTDEILAVEKSAEIPGNCVISGSVTEEDSKSILFMMDEEKMARDVYSFFSSRYTMPVFRNISKSEGIHMKAVANLIAGFNLTYTGTDTPGSFVDPVISALYKQLTDKGSVSLDEALKAGALIEETDILDLEKEIIKTQNTSVKTVYSNLLKASENHLRAFTGILKARKIIYEPVLLSTAYYNAVLSKTTATVDYDGKRSKNHQ